MIPLKDNIPTDRRPLVTIALIVVNVVVYLITVRHGSLWSGPDGDTVVHYGAIPYEFTHPGKHCDLVPAFSSAAGNIACEGQPHVVGHASSQLSTPLTAFSSMFMHASLLHIAGNMLFLWIFGKSIEDSLGRVRFVVFYLLGGLAALALQILVGPDSTAPTVGASGAMAAVMGGYILLYPRARVLTIVFIFFFFTVVELQALVVLGLWFLLQVLYGRAELVNPTGGGGGVAYFAHVGGFLFGLALIHAFVQRRKVIEPRYPLY
jgi:membrane associated rhomboid family serine protease